MDSSSFASIPFFGMRYDCSRISGLLFSIDFAMLGHDGLFARQFPIASSCISHLVLRGFYRRRFDLFAIVRLAVQSWIETLLLFGWRNKESRHLVQSIAVDILYRA